MSRISPEHHRVATLVSHNPICTEAQAEHPPTSLCYPSRCHFLSPTPLFQLVM